MDLRDHFAAQFATALVSVFPAPDEIARRAYDLAEAMLAERARRMDADEASAIAAEPHASLVPAGHRTALLDEPYPMSEPLDEDELDPRWLEPAYDPSWDLEDRIRPDSARPGLARTQPGDVDSRKERSA